MRIEVINTGSELLLGKVVNTHLAFLGQELFKLGLRVQRQIAIPDGDEIAEVLTECFPRTDVLIITGGLGPTADDVTREVVAALLNRRLVFDPSIMEAIEAIFRRRSLEIHESNRRQAMVPEGATVLPNPLGTAPGLFVPADIATDSPHLFLLPGPPRELLPMFRAQVLPRLQEWAEEAGITVCWHNFRIQGLGESRIAAMADPVVAQIPDLEVGYCARLGEVDLRLIGSEESVARAAEALRHLLAEHIATESETPVEQVLVELLAKKGETVATAESCTGGLIVSSITDVPGSSAVLGSSYVTYSNEAKTKILGVEPALLETYGAVSEPVARAMAEGCLRISGADHALAVSGIAGPGGGSPEKPVGTVCVALASQGAPIWTATFLFPTDRASFKRRVTCLMLDQLRRRLIGASLEAY